ncbi:Rieske (2Fe-2S) protein [Spirilliplanes yamanashiensis]|uniref:Rieske domain-containing protein n=1 Tax=Spirilliplanes yamanashiensis TaxID=42233 RepID=A0A8J3Y7N9_9ACTN|nr:Rieske (2Fe-2S) protein [Spirilliplanes yamanashiensis]MDP9815189.1 nitrite reductase/ring-hydroxylating ferredoxin subunit/uncharacterized membrane protein [Spirilliplanes yamanashiensis]GIJ02815.1 hypothetical protein Sya03_21670 [Spirilliplanes yamanashiensis]
MLRQLVNRLEQASALDPAGDKLKAAVQATIRPRKLRDVLHGVFLGHPLHPVLVQLPVGAFMSAAVLDLLPGQRRAATALVATGVAGALPAAAAGLTDWASLAREQRRVGLVHAVGNTIALGLYAGSLAARMTGRHRFGRMLGYAGLSVAGGSAYLGGHLSYKEGAGVNHAVPELRMIPEGWHHVASMAELPVGKPVVRTVGSAPVLLYRHGDSVTAMIERCAHQGGPLSEGEVTGSGPSACVVCPWHGSTFRLTDGLVVRGPAASDQPVLRTRVAGGQVEISLP